MSLALELPFLTSIQKFKDRSGMSDIRIHSNFGTEPPLPLHVVPSRRLRCSLATRVLPMPMPIADHRAGDFDLPLSLSL